MSLTPNYTFNGSGNWSLDATGGSTTAGGDMTAIVPEGSHVEAAFLYASTFNSTSDPAAVSATMTAGGQDLVLTAANFTALGNTAGLQAFRANVTDYVAGIIGDGDAANFTFNMHALLGGSVDGYTLVVVYSNPNEAEHTITLLDGFSATTGDNFSVSFAEPVDTTIAGFQALMSLGIGYSAAGTQYSKITVNDRDLTSAAGGYDDGQLNNGALITIGGVGDSPVNPDDPTAQSSDTRYDDELYNLALGNAANATPFLPDGSTRIDVTTVNPSNDDNIFFVGFNLSGFAAVETPAQDGLRFGDGGNDGQWRLTGTPDAPLPEPASGIPSADSIETAVLSPDGPPTLYDGKVAFSSGDADVYDVVGLWNSVKNVQYVVDTAGTVVFDGFVHVDAQFGGDTSSFVALTGAKRGNVVTGGGGDSVTIQMTSNEDSWVNDFRVSSGGGNDTVTLRGLDVAAKLAGGDTTYSGVVDTAGGFDTSGTTQKTYTLLGDGDDRFIGYGSSDEIWGGAGNDTFVYVNTASGEDIIHDFTTGEDHIDVSALNLTFATLTTASTEDGLLITLPTGTILLEGVTAVTASDFIFAQMA